MHQEMYFGTIPLSGSGSERLYDIIQTSDGGFLIGGSSLSSISGDKTEDNLKL